MTLTGAVAEDGVDEEMDDVAVFVVWHFGVVNDEVIDEIVSVSDRLGELGVLRVGARGEVW